MKKLLLFSTALFWSLCTFGQITVSTFAGSGSIGSADGTGTAASFYYQQGVAVDAAGNVYVADYGNHKIRKITAAGVVSTLAGSGTEGSTDGTGTAASFKSPQGVAVDGAGNVYVADYGNHKIRKITAAGIVSTLAGSGTTGSTNGVGTSASFNFPYGVAVDAAGNVYVGDVGNHRIRKITAAGVVSTLAGSGTAGNTDGAGTAASFNYPHGVAVDAVGNVYVGDRDNYKIRKITATGVVSTFAGSGFASSVDGSATSASFNNPTGVAVDVAGNVYVTDRLGYKIRKITAAGFVSTLAGSGIIGNTDGAGTAASFSYPYGVTVDATGNVYVADTYNHKIRKVVDATLATADFDIASNIIMYPNPAKDHFQVDLENSLELKTITVYNNLGQQVLTTNSSNVNTSSLSKGMYYVEIVTNAGKANKKIIVE